MPTATAAAPSAAPALKVRKRSGSVVDFRLAKVVQAIRLCLVNGCLREDDDATLALSIRVANRIQAILGKNPDTTTTVEQVQDLAETVLMSFGEHDAAKHYILYRDERKRLREAQEAARVSVFKPRATFKPVAYRWPNDFKRAIQKSYWTDEELNFSGDVHEFKTALTPVERNAAKNTVLAIAQVEVSVKRFWANLGQRFPKSPRSSRSGTCSPSPRSATPTRTASCSTPSA
jgi:ribonucleoside-diphosphate reductase beta chain